MYLFFFHRTSSALAITLLSLAMPQVTNGGYIESRGADKGFISKEHVFIITHRCFRSYSLHRSLSKTVLISISETPNTSGVFSPRSDQFNTAILESKTTLEVPQVLGGSY